MNLSIGITSYNQHQYVEKTIVSLLNQTERPYEIVVSDNHSTDGSYEIIKKYASKLKIIRPASHLPYYEHINFLLDNLSGDFVLFSASDDIYLPNFVSECNKHMKKDFSIIKFGYNLIDENDAVFSTIRFKRCRRNCLGTSGGIIESICFNSVPMWSSIMNRTALIESGGFGNKGIHFDHDWATAVKLSSYGKYVTIPGTVVCNYRYQYRPDTERIRLEGETNDTVLMCTQILKELFYKNNLSGHLLKLATIFNLKAKIKLHQKYGFDYTNLYDKFGVSKDDVDKFSKWDYYYLMLRTRFLKR